MLLLIEGPLDSDRADNDRLGLRNAARATLKRCEEKQIKRLAFPALGTGAVGTVVATLSKALTGVSATGSPGFVSLGQKGFRSLVLFELGGVSKGNVVALTGVSATGEVGGVRPSGIEWPSFELRGSQRARPGYGPYSPPRYYVAPLRRYYDAFGVPVDVGITGVGGTGEVGSVGVTGGAVSAAITGVSATAAVGTVIPNVDVLSTTVAATGAVGTPGTASTVPLTSASSTGVAGSVGLEGDLILGLTGVQATGSVGTLSHEVSVATTGVQATGAVAAAADVRFQSFLSQVTALGQVGNVTPLGGEPWVPVNDNGGSGWTPVPKPGSGGWTPVDDTELRDWTSVV